MTMNKEDFELWKEHNVTRLLYRRLAEQLEIVQESLRDESLFTTEGVLELKRLSGMREVLSQILTLEIEDFIE